MGLSDAKKRENHPFENKEKQNVQEVQVKKYGIENKRMNQKENTCKIEEISNCYIIYIEGENEKEQEIYMKGEWLNHSAEV